MSTGYFPGGGSVRVGLVNSGAIRS